MLFDLLCISDSFGNFVKNMTIWEIMSKNTYNYDLTYGIGKSNGESCKLGKPRVFEQQNKKH